MATLLGSAANYTVTLMDSCLMRLGCLKLFGVSYYAPHEVWPEARECYALLGPTVGGAIASGEAFFVTGIGLLGIALIMFFTFLIVLGVGFALFILVVWFTCPRAISWTLHDVYTRPAHAPRGRE